MRAKVAKRLRKETKALFGTNNPDGASKHYKKLKKQYYASV